MVEGDAQVMNIRLAQRNYRSGWLLCLAAMLFPTAVAFGQSVAADAKQYRFEVATIKPNVKHDGTWRLEFTPDGFK